MMESNSTVPREIPWPMLPRTKDDQEKGWIRFYSISHKKHFFITIPNDNDNEVRWTNCLNSSGKWLMVLDDISDLHMLNPITGTHIPLPPLATFDGVKPLYEEEPTGGRIIDYVLPYEFPHPITTAQRAAINIMYTFPSTYPSHEICGEDDPLDKGIENCKRSTFRQHGSPASMKSEDHPSSASTQARGGLPPFPFSRWKFENGLLGRDAQRIFQEELPLFADEVG